MKPLVTRWLLVLLGLTPPSTPPDSRAVSSFRSKVQVLYGGTDLFDYEVRRTFSNDMLLAFISSSCIAALVYVLTSCSGRPHPRVLLARARGGQGGLEPSVSVPGVLLRSHPPPRASRVGALPGARLPC